MSNNPTLADDERQIVKALEGIEARLDAQNVLLSSAVTALASIASSLASIAAEDQPSPQTPSGLDISPTVGS